MLFRSQRMRQLMAVYRDAEDLIHIGAYVKGSSAKIDESIAKIDAINDFLCQGIFEVDGYEETEQKLEAITGQPPAAPAAPQPAAGEAKATAG